MSSVFDPTYSPVAIRFWRVPWHREALQVLAEAISASDEADRLEYEWSLIQAGNRAEFGLRRTWALKVATSEQPGETPVDAWAWKDTPTWHQISTFYGPPQARHGGCLCKWLYDRPYPATAVAHGGAGDAGGRARRLIADLDSALAKVPANINEYTRERLMSATLGWLPAPPEEAA